MFIQMNNARKSYGKGENTVHALDGIELALEQGKIYVILGPSGSGKSTLLNMMGGLDSLDEGSITVDGKEISRLKSGELTERLMLALCSSSTICCRISQLRRIYRS